MKLMARRHSQQFKSGTLEFSSMKSVITLDGLADGTYILHIEAVDFHELLIIQQ